MNAPHLVSDPSATARAAVLLQEQQQVIAQRTDRLLQKLMIFQCFAGVFAAIWISPRTWAGLDSRVHPHVWAALLLGSLIASLPVLLAQIRPGHVLTRQAFAAGQMFMSALFIHLSGGRLETHFHIFGSLAILSFYRDWRVLVTASAVIFVDHLALGLYWPESVYGVNWAPLWRAFEHAGWVVFEDLFLLIAMHQNMQEMRRAADHQAFLETSKASIEQFVVERTAERTVELSEENALRKTLEEKYRKSECFLHSTLDALSSHIAILDSTGRIVAVNAAWNHFAEMNGAGENSFGPGTDYLAACEASTGFCSGEAAVVAAGLRRVMSGQQREFQLEYPCHSPEEQRWFVVRVTCFHGEDSLHMVVAHENVTERKETENALRESHEKFHQLADNITDVFWIRSPDLSEVQYLSPAFERVWGCSVETFCENPQQWTEMIFAEDRTWVEEAFAALTGETPSLDIEYRIMRPDGEMRWVHVRGFQVRNSSHQLIRHIGVVTDITERKQADAELQKAHQQLLEISRQAGMAEVATGVLHNVGNVLNSVNVSATLVSEGLKKSKLADLGRVVQLLDQHAADLSAFLSSDARGQHLRPFLRQLHECLALERRDLLQEVESLRQNIEHIKDIVSMQQTYGKISGVTETVQITDLIEDTLRMNVEALAQHEVQVVRDFAPVPPVTVEKHRVLQILVNLVRNAKHACQASERTDRILALRVFNGQGSVKIQVADNGIGIPAENLTRIFHHGFTTKKDGHGFGLHSSALTAKELAGSLTVQSAGPGHGATFTLELPLRGHGGRPDSPKP